MLRHDINARRVNIISAIVIIVIYTRLYMDFLYLFTRRSNITIAEI